MAGSSPCNTRIAAALLDVLAASGDADGRRRALAAAGLDEETLRRPDGWIPEAALRAMFRAARADRRLGRCVGEALVTPTALGLALRVGGVGNVSKAYRRVDQLAAREAEDAGYAVGELGGERARIHFEPAPGATPEEAWCGMREGMLARIPALYGLPPAEVSETACARLGASRCRFEVRWRSARRTGLVAGGLGGAALGAVLGAGLGGGPGAVGAVALVAGALGAAAGRGLDLAAELHAQDLLRRARYGVLAQAERELAEKIDELAKLDGVVAEARARRAGSGAGSAGRGAPGDEADVAEGDAALRRAAGAAARRLDRSLTSLEREAGRLHRAAARGAGLPTGAAPEPGGLAAVVEAARDLRDGIADLERALGVGGGLEPRPLAPLVERAAARLEDELRGRPRLELAIEEDLPDVRCRAADVERMVTRLVRASALADLGARRIEVSLRATPGAVELVVESDGAGLEHDAIEQVFDPFLAAPPPADADDDVADAAGPAGLGAVWPALEEHGGQLRVETDPERGIRVTAVFPRVA